MRDFEEEYKKQTGYNVGKLHDVGCDYVSSDYVKWLESKLIKTKKGNRTFKVYFEIYSKKILVKVHAENEEEAKEIVKSNLKFYKIEKDENDYFNKSMDLIDDIINKLK